MLSFLSALPFYALTGMGVTFLGCLLALIAGFRHIRHTSVLLSDPFTRTCVLAVTILTTGAIMDSFAIAVASQNLLVMVAIAIGSGVGITMITYGWWRLFGPAFHYFDTKGWFRPKVKRWSDLGLRRSLPVKLPAQN